MVQMSRSVSSLTVYCKDNIAILSKIIKIFNIICKNDGLCFDFTICIFFNNTTYLEFIESQLEFVFTFLPVQDSHPKCKSLIFEGMSSLIVNDIEEVVAYISPSLFPKIVGYFESRVREDITQHQTNAEGNYITEEANLYSLKGTLSSMSRYVSRELRVKEPRIIQRVVQFQAAFNESAASIVSSIIIGSINFNYKSLTATIFSDIIFNVLVASGDRMGGVMQQAVDEVCRIQSTKTKRSNHMVRKYLTELFGEWRSGAFGLMDFSQKYIKFVGQFIEEIVYCN